MATVGAPGKVKPEPQPCAEGTAMLATTGISVAPIENRRRREIASSPFGRMLTRSPLLSSSPSAMRTRSSPSGASAASGNSLARSVVVRWPSARRHTSAAVLLSRCAVCVCWSYTTSSSPTA